MNPKRIDRSVGRLGTMMTQLAGSTSDQPADFSESIIAILMFYHEETCKHTEDLNRLPVTSY
jgi:hypothetical protein